MNTVLLLLFKLNQFTSIQIEKTVGHKKHCFIKELCFALTRIGVNLTFIFRCKVLYSVI